MTDEWLLCEGLLSSEDHLNILRATYVDVHEASRIVGVRPPTIRAFVRQGRILYARRVGCKLYLLRSEVQNFAHAYLPRHQRVQR